MDPVAGQLKLHRNRYFLLLAQGLCLALLAYLLPYLLGIRGLELAIAGIFLSAIALSKSLDNCLASARGPENISLCGSLSGLLACSILFAGFGAGLIILTVGVPEEQLWLVFGFADEIGLLTTGNLGQGQFAPFSDVLLHNLGIMATIVILSAVYGMPGLAISLTWNITVWTVVLAPMVCRTVSASGNASETALFVSVLAISPHVLLEFLAYLHAGCIAVTTRVLVVEAQKVRSNLQFPLQNLLISLLLSGLLLALAAFSESHFSAFILGFLPGWDL